MSRHIFCRECGSKSGLTADDRRRGWTERSVYLSVQVPEGHGMRINGQLIPMQELHCDLCDEPLPNGTIAVAVTRNPPGKEVADWEECFGTPLPAHTVNAVDTLTKGKS